MRGGAGRNRVNEAMTTLYSGDKHNKASRMTERSGEAEQQVASAAWKGYELDGG
jgi:hypothetical protein